MAALTVDFRKHSGPTPADDMAAQIITDCGNFTLDFNQHGFCASRLFLQTLGPCFQMKCKIYFHLKRGLWTTGQQSRGLIYKMLRRNHSKFHLTIISKICVRAIHRMNVRTEIARTRLFQMWNLWIANDLELAHNWLVSALCLVNDS